MAQCPVQQQGLRLVCHWFTLGGKEVSGFQVPSIGWTTVGSQAHGRGGQRGAV